MTIAPAYRPTVKRSVSIREDLDQRVAERSGVRGYSSFVNRALETQLQLDLLDDYIAVAVAEHGPVPEETMAEVLADIEAAKARR